MEIEIATNAASDLAKCIDNIDVIIVVIAKRANFLFFLKMENVHPVKIKTHGAK